MLNFRNVDELKRYLENEILLTNEACQYLGVSAQRLHQLVQSGKIVPIKSTKSNSIFLKSDLYERKFETERIYGYTKTPVHDQNQKDQENEAVFYFTLLNLFGGKVKKCDPIYQHLVNQIDTKLDIQEIINDVVDLTGFLEGDILTEYNSVMRSFETLLPTDYIVKIGTDLYPTQLEKTAHAPMFLFMRGNPNLLTFNMISIVGTRNPSDDGVEKAKFLSKKMGQNRVVVASGLAKGIDTAAHEAALASNNPTVAVIGTPITQTYPKENKDLQKSIEDSGLIISQFPPGSKVQRWNFPMRNAVMSGISLATVIIEAGETSGSLIQADYALKQGRSVFIPKGAIDNNDLAWPKKYIQRNGAYSFSSIEELLSNLSGHYKEMLNGSSEIQNVKKSVESVLKDVY